MAIYKPTHFADFKPINDFEKWAAVEVTDFESVPNLHFEVLGDKYKNADPDSEEEIWIPIQKK